MTTLVATRQALQLLSMGNQAGRRTSKRLAAAGDYEQDDDFHYVRKSKKVKTDNQDPSPEPPVMRKNGRGRPAKGGASKATAIPEEDDEAIFATTKATTRKNTRRIPIPEDEAPVPVTKPRTKKPTRRQASVDVSEAPKEDSSAPAAKIGTTKDPTTGIRQSVEVQDEPELRVTKNYNRKTTRQAPETEKPMVQDATSTTTTNGASRGTTSKKSSTRHVQTDSQGDSKDEDTRTNGTSRDRGAKEREQQLQGPKEWDISPQRGPPVQAQSAKIALPMSDTPIINRNKEMRRNGGNTNRRSSMGTRGRRASSLIDNGQTAMPHKEVRSGEFYKHIEAEGLPEPRRMKQLLTWCGTRALSEKPPLGSKNASIIHGARAIQDQILKDFSSRSDFSDWFSRDAEPKAPVILKPNPKNIELDEKLVVLEENIKRLQEEKKAWLAMRKPPPEQVQLFSSSSSTFNNPITTTTVVLPDFDLLDPEDGRIRNLLVDTESSFLAIRTRTEKRLQTIQSGLEFQVDLLADNLHKLEQRVRVAGREADEVLRLSAVRLKEREERERVGCGTRDMPIMEVLRSLGSILPEAGGGGGGGGLG